VCIEALTPLLPDLLPLCVAGVGAGMNATVSNNASWAIGEICIKVPNLMDPYLDAIVPALVSVLQRPPGMGPGMQQMSRHQLNTNVCITLGRLGVGCGDKMGKHLPSFLPLWCGIMRIARFDVEKVRAFQGLVNMIRANSQAGLQCFPQLVMAICSLMPCPPFLVPTFREILQGYQQAMGPQWAQVYAALPDEIKQRLQHMYQIGAA